MNFRNAVDVDILLDCDQLQLDDINKLVSAGVKILGFSDFAQMDRMKSQLLPCKKHFLGDLENNILQDIIDNFDLIESIVDVKQVHSISDLNARTGKITNVLARMNVLSGIKKFGLLPAEMSEECFQIAKTSGIRLVGISTYVPPIENLKMRKVALRKSGVMFKMLEARFRGIERFSMNYINKFEDLVVEGVNEIRIGIKDLA